MPGVMKDLHALGVKVVRYLLSIFQTGKLVKPTTPNNNNNNNSPPTSSRQAAPPTPPATYPRESKEKEQERHRPRSNFTPPGQSDDVRRRQDEPVVSAYFTVAPHDT